MYFSRPTGQAFYQNVRGAPFSVFRIECRSRKRRGDISGAFPAAISHARLLSFFPAYSPTTTTTIYSVAPSFRPALIQQYSLNIQAELHKGWLLEVGYVGTRGTHLVRQRSLNQAMAASANNPIRGVTSNTLANISLRVPVAGVPPDSLEVMESAGSSWYNGLEASLTKRLSHGLQFLASYTFSKTLDTDGANINGTSSGNALTLGNQNSPRQRWGRASFDRTHRFVFSTTWTLPSPPHGLSRLAGRLVSGCHSNHPVRERAYYCRYKFHQCFWNQRRSGTIKRYMLKKPVGDRRGRAVEIKPVFQRILFYDSAGNWCRWHWNSVREQRDRDRKRSRASESGSRVFKSCGAQLAR